MKELTQKAGNEQILVDICLPGSIITYGYGRNGASPFPAFGFGEILWDPILHYGSTVHHFG